MSLIPGLIEIVNNAAAQILEVYHDGDLFKEIERKSDHSPVTLADRRANKVIVDGLSQLTPEIPVISEEGKNIPFEDRQHWTKFWLVDPLDGTKEFIKRNGQFTVNIALIDGGIPVLGIIQIPVSGTIYYCENGKAYKIVDNQHTEIGVNNKRTDLISIGSSSHASETESLFLQKFNITQHTKAGSSLKFCYVADGQADIYYREGPTMEWDTAAGHAIILAAGGKVEGITYNKPNLLNGGFCCYGF